MVPISVADQTKQTILRINTIIEKLAVTHLVVQGLTEEQPGVGVGGQLAGGGGGGASHVNGVAVFPTMIQMRPSKKHRRQSVVRQYGARVAQCALVHCQQSCNCSPRG